MGGTGEDVGQEQGKVGYLCAGRHMCIMHDERHYWTKRFRTSFVPVSIKGEIEEYYTQNERYGEEVNLFAWPVIPKGP
jgi:hypothetical protein